MNRPLAVAAVGFWHVHARDYAQALQQNPRTDLVAIWDDDDVRGRQAASEFGVEFVSDLEELLSRSDIDGVTITTSTDRHHDVITRAIRAGKHVFSEKVLAPEPHQAEDLVHLAAEMSVALVVSLPRLYDGYTQTLNAIIDSGELGDLTYTRVRLAHDGLLSGWLPERFANPQEAIGGALTDLGCHPVYLTRLFHRSEPLAVSAVYGSSTGYPVEDNAVVAADFGQGAVGVVEASLASAPGQFTIELRGTKGVALYGFGGLADILVSTDPAGDKWRHVTPESSAPGALDRWIRHIADRSIDAENLDHALALTRFVAAANESARTGSTVAIPEPAASAVLTSR
jgi:predicted dehydrogenase